MNSLKVFFSSPGAEFGILGARGLLNWMPNEVLYGIMKKIKLTVILDCFSIGGAEHMVYELLKNIDTDHFDVSVLCYMCKQNTPLEQQVESLFPITYLNHTGQITIGTILRVVGAIQKTKPDIVHAHLGGAGFGAIWTILCRKPLVITVHTKPEKAFTKKIELFVRTALQAGRTMVVAVSRENASLVRDYYGLAPWQYTCVNNGIDLQRFHSTKHKPFTLINVARQDDNKNQAALIRCFGRLHTQHLETKLLLLGDGDNHEMLKAQTVALGIADAVTFTSNVVNTEDYYAISDLYVQCSFREAMPLSVLEAMAAGLPVVATNVGGLADVVQENGILVPVGDEDALYRAIEQIFLQKQEETKKMSQVSLRLVQDYSSTSMARAYERIYIKMCE